MWDGGWVSQTVSDVFETLRVAFGRRSSVRAENGSGRERAPPRAPREIIAKPLKHASRTRFRVYSRGVGRCPRGYERRALPPRAFGRAYIPRDTSATASTKLVLRVRSPSRVSFFARRVRRGEDVCRALTRTSTSRGCRRGTRASCGRFGAPAGPRSARGGRRCGIGGTVGAKRGMRVSDRTGMRRTKLREREKNDEGEGVRGRLGGARPDDETRPHRRRTLPMDPEGNHARRQRLDDEARTPPGTVRP